MFCFFHQTPPLIRPRRPEKIPSLAWKHCKPVPAMFCRKLNSTDSWNWSKSWNNDGDQNTFKILIKCSLFYLLMQVFQTSVFISLFILMLDSLWVWTLNHSIEDNRRVFCVSLALYMRNFSLLLYNLVIFIFFMYFFSKIILPEKPHLSFRYFLFISTQDEILYLSPFLPKLSSLLDGYRAIIMLNYWVISNLIFGFDSLRTSQLI